MSAFNLANVAPQVFERDVDRSQISWPYPYWQDTPGVLIAGKDMLRAAGDAPGAADPYGWSPGAGGFEKPACNGIHTLRVNQWGDFWVPERSIKLIIRRHKLQEIQALVFAFGQVPIWTHTRGAAMRLAEHCDPIPRTPVAGHWATAYMCT